MKKNEEITTKTPACAKALAGRYNNLFERIAEILNQARGKVVREINKVQVLTHWEIGREIVEFEQKGKVRAEYWLFSSARNYIGSDDFALEVELYQS